MDDALGAYLRGIARYPLLSAAEEVELARIVRAADDTTDARLQANATRAGQRLVQSNLRLVVRICRKWRSASRTGPGLDFLDLVQEGNLGLHHAVRKYDPARGYRFTTYAWAWVESYIRRAIATRSRLIRLPTQMGDRLSRLRLVLEDYARTGDVPTIDAIAERLNVQPRDVHTLLQFQSNPISIDAALREDSDESWLDVVLADDAAAREQATAELWSDVEAILLDADLSPDEWRDVVAVIWDEAPIRKHPAYRRAIAKAREAAHDHQLRLHFDSFALSPDHPGPGPDRHPG